MKLMSAAYPTGRYFIDASTNELFLFYNATSGTPPPAGAVTVAQLAELITITGSAAAPAEDIALRGLTVTGSRPTFLSQPFKAPSGGAFAQFSTTYDCNFATFPSVNVWCNG
jgi:hypothetical protein